VAEDELGGSQTIAVPDPAEAMHDGDVNSLFANSSFPWNLELDSLLLDDDTFNRFLDPRNVDAFV
jgi:hypothetical protein